MDRTQGENNSPRVAIIGKDSYAKVGLVTLIREINANAVITASLNNYQAFDIFLSQYSVDIILLVVGCGDDIGLNCLRIMYQIEHHYPKIQLLVYARQVTSFLLRAQQTGWLQLVDASAATCRKRFSALLALHIATEKKRANARKNNFILTRDEWLVINDIHAGKSLSSIARIRGMKYRKVSALKMSAVRKLGLRTKNDLLVFLAN